MNDGIKAGATKSGKNTVMSRPVYDEKTRNGLDSARLLVWQASIAECLRDERLFVR